MTPESTADRQARLAFWSWQDRQLRASDPPRLDDGRRVVRVFPEWCCELPLWESYTDNYPFSRDTLPISGDLLDALTAWNAEWQDREPEMELTDAERWLIDGDALVARLRRELDGIAEVRAEFGH